MIAQAEITTATLYPSHGELTWEERKQVSTGVGTVEIEGLPVSLQDQSLQVALEGLSESQIHQVQISRVEQAEFVAGETRWRSDTGASGYYAAASDVSVARR